MTEKHRKLESAVVAIQQTHGPRAIQRGLAARVLPPHIATGFPALDEITGCGGVPLGALSLFSGPATSGKSTLAYKVLAGAQTLQGMAALLDLTHTTDPDYLRRCGVDLSRLLIVRPGRAEESTPLLLDIVQSRQPSCVLVDGLLELTADSRLERQFHSALGRLLLLARTAGCAVVLLAESPQRWHRWLNLNSMTAERQNAALHIDLQRERWLYREGELIGYAARVQLLRSLWRRGAPSTTIAIEFNGVVRARAVW